MKKLVIAIAVLWYAAMAYGVTIDSLWRSGGTVEQYSKYEIVFTLDTSYENPFDLDEIDITVVMHLPDGSEQIVPAFFMREYDVVGSAPERYINAGEEEWRMLYAPAIVGEYSYDIRIDETGEDAFFENVGQFSCITGDKKGFIQRDETDLACLRYDNGDVRINIGHNVCWVSDELAGCETYFSQMAAAGENWTRIWMCPWGGDGWVIIENDLGHWSGNFQGVGRYSMQTAQRLDQVIELAEQYGIAIQLVLQYHGAFSTTTNSNWNSNPYNVDNPEDGGFLEAAEDFFSNEEAKRLSRNKYRYIIARWGYSSSILAWELWNEVQFTDGWRLSRPDVVSWHDEMSQYLRQIDPHGHLITTSSHTSGFEDIWSLAGIDLIQVHHYGTPVINPFYTIPLDMAETYQKPVVYGEFGAGSIEGMNSETNVESLPEPYKSQMKDGLVLRNGIWSAFFSKSSSHLWWWDHYIEPYDQYRVFEPLTTFIEGEDIRGMVKADRAVAGYEPILGNPQIHDFNYSHTMTDFYQDGAVFTGMDHLSTYLQGVWHGESRSDPIFHLNMDQPGELVIHVTNVSSYGNNSLQILVNSVVVFSQGYAAGTSGFTINVPMPAGDIVVQVENTGQDWFNIASYEFRNSSIHSLGLTSEEHALYWIYDDHGYYGGPGCDVVTGETLYINGLNDGVYDVQFYASAGQGGVIHTWQGQSEHGEMTCTIPDFSWDIAVKVNKACIVGMGDLILLAEQWLMSGNDLATDYNDDMQVDLEDVGMLGQYWQGVCPEGWGD